MKSLSLFVSAMLWVLGASFGFAQTLSTSIHLQPVGRNSASLPVEAQSTISASLGHDLLDYQVRGRGDGFQAENPRHNFSIDFSCADVEVHEGGARWAMALRGYGYADNLKAVQPVDPHVSFNRVEYRRGPMTEWYVNGPIGLEQGFIFNEQPSRTGASPNGSQPLTVALALSGDLTAKIDQDRTGLTLTRNDGKRALHYSGLAARDAMGIELRAWLEVTPDARLLLKVEDAGAVYPIVVDPLVQLLATLSAPDGLPVAVSGDTVVVGGSSAAYVFVKPATGWADITETAELTPSDGSAQFGGSVAINENTVVVGDGPAEGWEDPNELCGAAYVFQKPARGWTDMTETAGLTETDGDYPPFGYCDGFATAVGTSGDTIVASAPGANFGSGAVYVFEKPKIGWKTTSGFAAKLMSPGSLFTFGGAIAISGDTVVVGDTQFNGGGYGAAYVYVKPPTGWTNMLPTATLAASDEGECFNQFGFSVAVDSDTVVVGALLTDGTVVFTAGQPCNNLNLYGGGAYVYVEPASGWTNITENAKLTDGQQNDGMGIAVAAESDNVVVAAANAVYVFHKPQGGWTTTSRLNAKLAAAQPYTLAPFSLVAIGGDTIVSTCQQGGAACVFGVESTENPDDAH